MPGLLDLPHELRLHIYEDAVTEPWPISILEYNDRSDSSGLVAAKSLRLVDRQLQAELWPLFWSNNTFGLYLAKHPMDHEAKHHSTQRIFCTWLERNVHTFAQFVRKLEFTVTAPCVRRRAALQHPKASGVWYRSDAPYCTTTITINLGSAADFAIMVEDDEGCDHAEYHARFRQISSGLIGQKSPVNVTKEMLWKLFDHCYHLTDPYRSRLVMKYSQAVERYGDKTPPGNP